MPGEDSDDGRERGALPDPADRVWFHPSELTSFMAATRPRTTRPSWKLVLAAVLGSCVVVGVVVTAGVIGRDHRSLPTAAKSSELDQRVIAAAGASVVAVRVIRSDGEVDHASGVCISPGEVLTSAHAVEGATALSVVTGRGATLAARAVGTDAATDVALLTVDGVVPAAKPATSSVRVGDRVIGLAASGRRHWVDVSDVRALDRYLTWSGEAVPGLIETDLTAAGQHSGGALLDRNGNLIGILVVPPGRDTSGYAMPITVARNVGEQLLLNGQARHGWLGVTATDDETARGGARVQAVAAASPAGEAGLRRDDVIVALDDGKSTIAVSTMGQLMAEVRERRPGESIELSLYRDGARRHVSVELGDLPTSVTPGSEAATATTAMVGGALGQP